MLLTLFKKNLLCLTAIFIAANFLTSCQKEVSGTGIDAANEPPNFSKKITSSVSGFVTDENEVAVQGATVVFGNASASTNKFGYFEIRNQQVVQQAAVVSIIKPGYFKAVKTYIATANKSAFFRVKLLPKTVAGTVDAAAGGKVSLNNGLSVTLPADAVVNAATGNVYTGVVSVAAQWLDPTATDLNRIMPGDLRGLNIDGTLKLLQTYGMAAVELTGASGELLQVATGKKAVVNFPLPAWIAGNAPNSIPLWYFDEAKGLWKEEGSATKSGNNFSAEVSHFSYWNCDIPFENSVAFDITLKDAYGNPAPYTQINVRYANGTYTGAHGYTDSTGYLNGTIPANSNLVLEIIEGIVCWQPLLTRSITTSTENISLGEMQLPLAATASIKGTVFNCNNLPVSNGYVFIKGMYSYTKVNTAGDGAFEHSYILCNDSSRLIDVIPGDYDTHQEGNAYPFTLVAGNNELGNIAACGIDRNEFINCTIGTSSFNIKIPSDQIIERLDSSTVDGIYVWGQKQSNPFNYAGFAFSGNNLAAGTSQVLTQFSSDIIPLTDAGNSSIQVHITEYGGIGEFIGGNFSGKVKSLDAPFADYDITVSFRVQRRF